MSSRCGPAAGKIPALAITKSSRPSSATPLATTSLSRSKSRTSRLLGDDAPTGLLDEVDGLVEILPGRHRVGDAVDLFAQIERDDVGAFLGEPNRVGAALTACRAR